MVTTRRETRRALRRRVITCIDSFQFPLSARARIASHAILPHSHPRTRAHAASRTHSCAIDGERARRFNPNPKALVCSSIAFARHTPPRRSPPCARRSRTHTVVFVRAFARRMSARERQRERTARERAPRALVRHQITPMNHPRSSLAMARLRARAPAPALETRVRYAPTRCVRLNAWI